MYPDDSTYRSWVGRPAQFDFTSLDGQRVSSEGLRGKVVLLDFWASWCSPCMESLPHLKGVYQRFHAHGLEIVGVNFDTERAPFESAVRAKDLTWPQYFDGAGRDNKLGQQFGIQHWPSLWLVDKRGNVRFISAYRDTDRKVVELLKEDETSAPQSRTGVFMETVRPLFARLLSPWKINVNASTRPAPAKPAEMAVQTTVATNNPVPPTPAPPTPEPTIPPVDLGEIKLRGITSGAKSSAVLDVGGRNQSVCVGDEFTINRPAGKIGVRCEKVEAGSVWLRILQNNARVEVRLANRGAAKP